ncbi:hypothetical protein [Sulfurimonas sp. HSL-1716]|uniref:hypothetical protein n=1 Tax=Hydrocurvibacter sulfurireducens TaxID=3131937 RepID=UPI0031F782D2
MKNILVELREDIRKTIMNEITDYDYRYRRYNINYSVLIGFAEELDLTSFESYIRKSDRFIVIKPNLCAIVLDCTDEKGGIKAGNNLLTRFQNLFFSKKLFASVVTASAHKDAIHLVNELYHLLSFGITHNMDNILIDSSQLFK